MFFYYGFAPYFACAKLYTFPIILSGPRRPQKRPNSVNLLFAFFQPLLLLSNFWGQFGLWSHVPCRSHKNIGDETTRHNFAHRGHDILECRRTPQVCQTSCDTCPIGSIERGLHKLACPMGTYHSSETDSHSADSITTISCRLSGTKSWRCRPVKRRMI